MLLLRVCMLTWIAALGACQAPDSALPDPLEAGWKGNPVCEKLYEDKEIRVLRCTFPPDGGHERHYHIRHFGYVLKGGRMQITDASGTREVDLNDGATWYSEGVEWHEVVNIGDTHSEYLIVEQKDR